MEFEISWFMYLITCTVLLTCYYGIIVYHSRRRKLTAIKESRGGKAPGSVIQVFDQEKVVEPDLGKLFQSLVDEFYALMKEVSNQSMDKEFFVGCLTQLLKKYSQLKDTGYDIAVINLMAVEIENKFSIRLSDDELLDLRKRRIE